MQDFFSSYQNETHFISHWPPKIKLPNQQSLKQADNEHLYHM